METTYIIKFVTVMASMILADVCWTKYFMTVAEKRAIPAGLWSAAIILFGAVCTTEYVSDRSLIIAAMIGAFIGSSATVFFKSKKESADSAKPHQP